MKTLIAVMIAIIVVMLQRYKEYKQPESLFWKEYMKLKVGGAR